MKPAGKSKQPKTKKFPGKAEQSDRAAASDSDEGEHVDSEQPAHYASLEIKKILHFNEDVDRINDLAAQLHREYVEASHVHPGAASAFYDQLLSFDSTHKRPSYLTHATDSLFETKHIKFENPVLNPYIAGGVCRDPTPEEYANYLAKTEKSTPLLTEENLIPLNVPSCSKTKKCRLKFLGATQSENEIDDEVIQSVLDATEVWKLHPDDSIVGRESVGTPSVVDQQITAPKGASSTHYPTKNAFVDTTKAQPFWVHLGIPMPSPPKAFLSNSFLKMNSAHSQVSGLVNNDNGVRRFSVPLNGFFNDEITFKIEGNRVAVTGAKPQNRRNQAQRQTFTEGFILPDDLDINELQVLRDDAGNVIFEEISPDRLRTETRTIGVRNIQ